jgi:hypothetical protein
VAVILRESGADERTIADALGQKTVEMARHYAKGADLSRKMRGVVKNFDAEVARRRFRGGLGRIQGERCLLNLLADKSVAEVLRPALADGLRLRAFGEHEEGHISPAAGLVEDLAVGRLVVDPDRLKGREFLPAGHARDRKPLAVGVLPDPDGAADEAGRFVVGFEGVIADEGGLVFVGAVIARAGGDGAKAFDGGDERKAALFRVVFVEDEGVDLAAQRIAAEAPGPMNKKREFVVGGVVGDGAPMRTRSRGL